MAIVIAFPYFALVFIFYNQSNGFIKNYDRQYAYWKTLPVLILSVLCYMLARGNNGRQRTYTAVGLLFGAIGDYLICIHGHGLFLGATAFAIGHIFYLLAFVHRVGTLCRSLSLLTTAASVLVLYQIISFILTSHLVAAIIMIAYSFLLSICVILSGSLYRCGGKHDKPLEKSNLIRFLGFVLFFLSDSALIINFIGFSLPFAEKIILFTYFTAQYLIFYGTSINDHLIDNQNYQNPSTGQRITQKCHD